MSINIRIFCFWKCHVTLWILRLNFKEDLSNIQHWSSDTGPATKDKHDHQLSCIWDEQENLLADSLNRLQSWIYARASNSKHPKKEHSYTKYDKL